MRNLASLAAVSSLCLLLPQCALLDAGDVAESRLQADAQDPAGGQPTHPEADPTTLIADYSDNRVFEVDRDGKVLFELQDVYGAWDAERTPEGNYLITEFSVSRVSERTPEGEVVWSYEDLKNPYDADLLPDGNVLIADTFGGRVIEVKPDRAQGKGGEVVWSYGKGGKGTNVRAFDADRLANGNTLIADVLEDRALEVNASGEVVWQARGLDNVHDADRLPNGNTLVTLRILNEVRELDRHGRAVWRLKDLASPSDADRLSNGHTLVAENSQVREFDAEGVEVWKQEASWAVEANRYPR